MNVKLIYLQCFIWQCDYCTFPCSVCRKITIVVFTKMIYMWREKSFTHSKMPRLRQHLYIKQVCDHHGVLRASPERWRSCRWHLPQLHHWEHRGGHGHRPVFVSTGQTRKKSSSLWKHVVGRHCLPCHHRPHNVWRSRSVAYIHVMIAKRVNDSLFSLSKEETYFSEEEWIPATLAIIGMFGATIYYLHIFCGTVSNGCTKLRNRQQLLFRTRWCHNLPSYCKPGKRFLTALKLDVNVIVLFHHRDYLRRLAWHDEC